MTWDYNYVVAIDFDGTLYHRDKKKADIDVMNFAKLVRYMGCVTILWTSRHGQELKEQLDICAKYGVIFDYVNEYPARTDSPKVCADLYIDNKATYNGKINTDRYLRRVIKEVKSGKYHLIDR